MEALYDVALILDDEYKHLKKAGKLSITGRRDFGKPSDDDSITLKDKVDVGKPRPRSFLPLGSAETAPSLTTECERLLDAPQRGRTVLTPWHRGPKRFPTLTFVGRAGVHLQYIGLRSTV